MNTSIMTIALATVLAPAWNSDYSQAQLLSAQQKKPLVVLFGAGTDGWTKVIKSESPSPEITKLLSDQYVCVYVDTNSPAGKKLAQTFGVSEAVGVVISDRAGATQAFWHQGDMTNANMVRYLQKYADPDVVVQGTETVQAATRISNYPQSLSIPTRSSGSC